MPGARVVIPERAFREVIRFYETVGDERTARRLKSDLELAEKNTDTWTRTTKTKGRRTYGSKNAVAAVLRVGSGPRPDPHNENGNES